MIDRRVAVGCGLRLGMLVLGFLLSATEPALAQNPADGFALFKQYCHRCHSPNDPQGGVDFASIRPEDIPQKTKLWKRAAKRVDDQEMPPEEAPQPSAADRATLLAWLAQAQGVRDCRPERQDPGPAPLRRLTRAEYLNTIQDLLGFPFDLTKSVSLTEEPYHELHFSNLAVNLPLTEPLLDQYFQAADVALDRLFATGQPGTNARRKLFGTLRPKDDPTAIAKERLTQFAQRAFRRPPDPADLERLLGFYRKSRAGGANHEEALRVALKPILVSPQFLLRIERERPAISPQRLGVPVDAHELAVRLSYFLWSTMPDEELSARADDGTLLDPVVLKAQTRRLFAHAKAEAWTQHFGLAWLQFPKLATARPSTEFFPNFNEKLKESMREEATAMLNHLRLSERPITDFIDADYSFVDETLAKHYGIQGVKGDQPVLVKFKPQDHRGGLLGMGGVLALTSHTFRTSPTQRGKYVLEVILGTPPPPPPPNAGTIAEDPNEAKKEPKSFRELLDAHARQASCAGCHKKIDPLGFALDRYDAVGQYRTAVSGRPLDVRGVLAGGTPVDGEISLKAELKRREREFVNHVCAKLLEYALGRELDSSDECALQGIREHVQARGDRLDEAIVAVVQSVPFRERRAAP